MMCRNLPALFVYNKGEIVKQIMTLKELGGPKVNAEIVEWVLQEAGILETDLEEDPRNSIRTNVRRLNVPYWGCVFLKQSILPSTDYPLDSGLFLSHR